MKISVLKYITYSRGSKVHVDGKVVIDAVALTVGYNYSHNFQSAGQETAIFIQEQQLSASFNHVIATSTKTFFRRSLRA